MADVTLDVKGLACPLPVLKAKKAMRDVPAGGTLEVFSTDEGSVQDFEAFCGVTKLVRVEHDVTDGVFRFLIQKPA